MWWRTSAFSLDVWYRWLSRRSVPSVVTCSATIPRGQRPPTDVAANERAQRSDELVIGGRLHSEVMADHSCGSCLVGGFRSGSDACGCGTSRNSVGWPARSASVLLGTTPVTPYLGTTRTPGPGRSPSIHAGAGLSLPPTFLQTAFSASPLSFGVEHRELVGGLLSLQAIGTWVPGEDS